MGHDLANATPPTRWLGRPIELHDVLDSTNLRAEDLAREGAPDGLAVLADRQTAGRGRLGRSFFSPPGVSLYLSLLLRSAIPPEDVHRHVFAAAVAVARVCRAELAGAPDVDRAVEIKWPNDVLIRGRKTSGINLTAQLSGGRLDALVLGIGVNVNPTEADFPEVLRGIATSLRIEAGRALDRRAVLEALLGELEPRIDALRADDFTRVLEEWREFFRMRGSRVRIGTLPDPQRPEGPVDVFEEAEGRVVGIDGQGALLLDTEAGERRILAGDVTVLDRGE